SILPGPSLAEVILQQGETKTAVGSQGSELSLMSSLYRVLWERKANQKPWCLKPLKDQSPETQAGVHLLQSVCILGKADVSIHLLKEHLQEILSSSPSETSKQGPIRCPRGTL
ncbi:mCG2552, isoform CRA_b, partial [Mus musculus]